MFWVILGVIVECLENCQSLFIATIPDQVAWTVDNWLSYKRTIRYERFRHSECDTNEQKGPKDTNDQRNTPILVVVRFYAKQHEMDKPARQSSN